MPDQNLAQEASWLGARLQEKTTYAGLAMLLGVAGFAHATQWSADIETIGIGLGMLIAGVTAIATSESKGKTIVKALVLFLAIAGLISLFAPAPANAQIAPPLPTKAPPSVFNSFLSGYPASGGFYFGINAAGATGKASGTTSASANAGALVTAQGEFGLTVGYAWANKNLPFWAAVEGTFDLANLNSSCPNGLCLGGPADFEQVVIVGAPFAFISSVIPQFANLQFPALVPLPQGVSAGPGNLYLGGGVYEQDVSQNFGLGAFQEWLIGGEALVGTRWLLSNSTALDIRFEYRTPSNSFCAGPSAGIVGCAGLGSSYLARTSILF